MALLRQFIRRTRRSDWRTYFGIGCVALLAALLAGTSWSARRSAAERVAAQERQAHTIEVLLETGRLRAVPFDTIRGERAPTTMWRSMARLESLTAHDMAQAARVRTLHQNAARFDRTPDRLTIAKMLRSIDAIETAERQLLAHSTSVARRVALENERYQYLLTAIGLILIAVTLVCSIFIRRALIREDEARRDLKRIASTDPLTGIANRRSLIDALQRAVAARDGVSRTLSFAIFDIDHFKRINDRFGHPIGDQVICEAVRRVAETLRSRDLIGRLGGEEFGILLPAADEDIARTICERLRTALADRPVRCGDCIIPITGSFGIAQLAPGESAEHVMARADTALYEAKNGGRNTVRLAA